MLTVGDVLAANYLIRSRFWVGLRPPRNHRLQNQRLTPPARAVGDLNLRLVRPDEMLASLLAVRVDTRAFI